jgi:hypothetical protein
MIIIVASNCKDGNAALQTAAGYQLLIDARVRLDENGYGPTLCS